MIYCHIPYCHRRCLYCGFFSTAGRHDIQQYVDCLCNEITIRAQQEYDNHPIQTIYIGGGTPSMLSIAQLKQLIHTLTTCFDLSTVAEVTLEANPDNLTPAYLQELQSLHFFNRLSIGIQSFDNNELALIGRIHTRQQALDAVNNAIAAGFTNLSIDLIYGLPYQDVAHWQHNLDMAARLPIKHLSCYALTVEPHTPLAHKVATHQLVLPSEDTVLEQYHRLTQWAQRQDFLQYEVSNFCQPGYPSRHNSRYWDRTPYLGFGAGAHSFDGHHRRWNVSNIAAYRHGINQSTTYYEAETLTPHEAYNEYVMTALRTSRGIEKDTIATLFATQQQHLASGMQPFIHNGWIHEDDKAYHPTTEGLLMADGMAVELFI